MLHVLWSNQEVNKAYSVLHNKLASLKTVWPTDGYGRKQCSRPMNRLDNWAQHRETCPSGSNAHQPTSRPTDEQHGWVGTVLNSRQHVRAVAVIDSEWRHRVKRTTEAKITNRMISWLSGNRAQLKITYPGGSGALLKSSRLTNGDCQNRWSRPMSS